MAPSTRRALRRQDSGRVQFVTEPIPTCGTSDALIRVHAVSLNYKDAGVAFGKFPWPGVEKGIVGSEFAGQILSVGENVKTFKTGDRVVSLINQYAITGNETSMDAQMGFSIDGTLAEYIVVPENVLVKIPDSLSWAEASMIPCSGVTAWNALRMPTFNISGKTVLIQGTGGTALVCLALAVKAGARVIVTSSSDEKLQRIKSLGAWGTVNYATNPDWETEVLKLTDRVGVDIVIEHGGAETLLKSVTSVKKGGQISQVGFLTSAGGGDFAALVGMIIYKVVHIVGIQTGIKVDLEDFMEFIRSTQLSFESCIDRVYDFEQAAEALEYSRSSKLFGKVIVKVA